MTTIFENTTLQHIVTSILDGTSGFNDINELLIINKTDTKYDKIVIKPCSIDITKQVLEILSDTKEKPEFVDTEINEFICYTKVIDEETNQETLFNQSLTETILIDSNILTSTGWQLIDFSEN